MKYKLAVFASQSGSNFQAIAEACQNNKLSAELSCLICDNPKAQVLERAKNLRIPYYVISLKDFPNEKSWNDEILKALKSQGIEVIALAGFMKKVGPQIIQEYENKIINTHPSLLPQFGGKGMYGMKVHNAVIAAGESHTGISVHLVNNEFDKGKVIAQRKIKIRSDESAEKLSSRLKIIENQFFIDCLEKFFSGSIGPDHPPLLLDS